MLGKLHGTHSQDSRWASKLRVEPGILRTRKIRTDDGLDWRYRPVESGWTILYISIYIYIYVWYTHTSIYVDMYVYCIICIYVNMFVYYVCIYIYSIIVCIMCQSPALLQLLPSQAPLAGGWHSWHRGNWGNWGNRFPMIIVILKSWLTNLQQQWVNHG